MKNKRLVLGVLLVILFGIAILLMTQTYRDSYQRAEHAIQTRQAQTQETIEAAR